MSAKSMQQRLQYAFTHPQERGFFYSANGHATASPRLNALDVWDWTPEKSISVPGNCTHLIPLAFGCAPTFTQEGKEWIRPCIHAPEDAERIAIPPVHAGRTGDFLQGIRQTAAMLPEGCRVREPDIQSPLGVAELMWNGDSFYPALMEEPAIVHGLLDKITDFTIGYIQAIREAAGDRLNAAGFPLIWSDATGTMIADDTMSLISPAMHREFSVPYLNRIARTCGPLYYHSCSWRSGYYDNIRQIGPVRTYNWNPGNSDDPAVLIRQFSGRAVLALHLVKDMHKDKDVVALGRNFSDECAFLRYILDAMQENTCMYWWFGNVVEKTDVIERIYDLLDERGFTPHAMGY